MADICPNGLPATEPSTNTPCEVPMSVITAAGTSPYTERTMVSDGDTDIDFTTKWSVPGICDDTADALLDARSDISYTVNLPDDRAVIVNLTNLESPVPAKPFPDIYSTESSLAFFEYLNEDSLVSTPDRSLTYT